MNFFLNRAANFGMFIRKKKARGHSYLYLVERVREGGRVRQRILCSLGRKDLLQVSGELERMAMALARHSERAMVLSDMEADRGMISAATVEALEARGLDYVLGARERNSRIIRDVVLNDSKPFTPLVTERQRGETQLFVKDVVVDGVRYIVCRNEAEAEKDRADRQAIIEGLQKKLATGGKALIGNSAYRKYLRRAPKGAKGRAFEIDPGKLADEAKYDGVFVLRTNTKLSPLLAVLRYRDLLQVEELFRRTKAILRTRPIYHKCDATIRGHVFCSFLALVLQKELAALCEEAGIVVEWADLLRDLDRLQEATIEKDGKRLTVRTSTTGQIGRIFQTARIALPPNRTETTA